VARPILPTACVPPPLTLLFLLNVLKLAEIKGKVKGVSES